MGVFMKEDDVYISSMLDLLNLRFGPTESSAEDDNGGIAEMVALQQEFKVFKRGRPFRDSAAVLGLGGFWNPRSRNRWFKLLAKLGKVGSNVKGKNGDEAIVAALIGNLASKGSLPVHFKAHDVASDNGEARVLIGLEPHPVVYDEREYLTISLPMKARRLGG